MTDFAFWIFWAGLIVVAYTYLGYGIVLAILSRFRRIAPSNDSQHGEFPQVTIVIAAHNEEDYIEEKIHNTLALDYPPERRRIFIINDGSTDRTLEILNRYQQVRVFHEPHRKGKIHAVNKVMKSVETPIVLFCDANTSLNPEALRKMIRHFKNEKVGGVAGEKRIFRKQDDNASGAGEGLYWRYESFLKKKDSEIYSVVGADGGLFAMRTSLYQETAENMIIEDFYISLSIAMKGFRILYEPEAVGLETASESVKEEWKRKVRISAGGFQAMALLLPLLNIFRYGMLSFQYTSHRVLRWTLAPLFLPLIMAANIILALNGAMLYKVLLAGQILFYALAWLGSIFQGKKVAIKGFFVPFYFTFMNLAVYAGFFRFLRGQQSVMWEKAARAGKI